MELTPFTKKLIAWSSLTTILAGIIHLWIVPEHFEHAPAHGILFLIVGVAQIVWGIAIWRRPSIKVYTIGAMMAGWLIVLYAITRLIPAPFGHGGPEAVDWVGLVCKLCEALGMLTVVILIFQGMVLKAGRPVAWRTVGMVVLFSFVAGFATYGIARAAEPYFPGLAGPAEEHHDESASDEGHDNGESTPTPEHEDGH